MWVQFSQTGGKARESESKQNVICSNNVTLEIVSETWAVVGNGGDEGEKGVTKFKVGRVHWASSAPAHAGPEGFELAMQQL